MTAASSPRRLIDEAAAAELLGMSNRKTLAAWRLRKQGPPYVKIGALVRYDSADLDAWIAAHRVIPTEGVK